MNGNTTLPVQSPRSAIHRYAVPQLSDIELDAVRFIERHTRTEGYPPTLAEIGEALHLTKPGAQSLVRRLVIKRAVDRGGRRMPRALTVNYEIADLERAVNGAA